MMLFYKKSYPENVDSLININNENILKCWLPHTRSINKMYLKVKIKIIF